MKNFVSSRKLRLCFCGCGEKTKISMRYIFGHYNKDGSCFRTHGMTGTATHWSWLKMNNRCNNANDPVFKWYGARGIKICSRWKKFENFMEDMGIRPDGKFLDRVDNNKGYSKSNCRWATMKEQNRNRRSNKFYEINGQRLCFTDWVEKYKQSPGRVYRKLLKGLDMKTALGEISVAGK